jgi:hypothetical protein
MLNEYCADDDCKRLEDVVSEFMETIITEDCSCDKIKEAFISACGKMKEVIRDFYSNDAGRGQEIKDVYAKIHDYTFNGRKMSYTDLNRVASVYNVYYDGMLSYIERVCKDNSLANSIDSYIEKDHVFVNNLVGDVEGKFHVANADIRDAFSNLEVLIDELPKIDKSYLENLPCSKCQDDSICCKLMLLYTRSVVHFLGKLICEEFKWFCEMKRALDPKTYLPENLKNIRPIEKKPVYQVF